MLRTRAVLHLTAVEQAAHQVPNGRVHSELHVEHARALHFAQGLFWFQAQFDSDQKEQQIVPVAMDLHYVRQVRHLDQLLDSARLAEQPAFGEG